MLIPVLALFLASALSQQEAADGWILLWEDATGPVRTPAIWENYRLRGDFQGDGILRPRPGIAVDLKASPKGEWRTLDVSVRGSNLVVRVDGKRIEAPRKFAYGAGSISIDGSLKLRNVRVRPLDLACLFNGKDLQGWRGASGAWAAADGAMAGQGTLHTVQAWDHFLLQYDIRGPAAVRVRSYPDVPDSGYLLPAADAGSWVTVTVAVRGARAWVWHNGVPEKDLTGLPERRGAIRFSSSATVEVKNVCITSLNTLGKE